MNKKELLKLAKERVDNLLKSQKEQEQETTHDLEATKLALLLESNQSIVEAVERGYFNTQAFADAVTNAVAQLKIEVPKADAPIVSVNVPDVHVPEIVLPQFNFPEIVIPEIVVPEPKVTVNIPEQKAPIVNVEAPIVNFPDKMDATLEYTAKNPLPVISVDPAGNFVNPVAGGGGARRVKIDNNASEPIPISGTISATFSADFGSGEIGGQTLRTVQATDAVSSVNIVGGSISTTPGATFYASDAVGSVNIVQSIPLEATQISGHAWSTYITGATGTIGVVTINPDGLPVYGGSGSSSSVSVTDIFGTTGANVVNPDGRLKVELPTGSSGLTDTELRASSLTVNQLSGANWSISVIDIFGSTATSMLNGDNRLRVAVDTGSSGLTDSELRASHLDVQQLSGATDSVNVVSTVGLTDTQLRASHIDVQQVSGAIDSVSVIGTVPISSSTTLDVQQVSGASWSTNVLSMPAVVVTSITNSIATSILNGDGTTLDPRNRNWTITETVPISSANTLDIKQVSGASDSVNVLSLPSVTVTSITNSTASALVDSTGVQYSGSNPLPTKEVRSVTPSQTSPSVTVASTSILAANTSRLGATIYNEGSATCYTKLGSTASLTSYTLQIASGGYYEVPFGYTGAIDGITSASTAQLRVTEIT